MRKGNCDKCGQSFVLNELVSVFNETLCDRCTEDRLKNTAQERITGETVYRLTDPTICARCGADGGQQEYGLLLEAPVCDSCGDYMRKYPFPLWIKAACLGLIVLVVFTISWNWRFFRARILMDRATKTGFQEGRFVEGAEQMQTAAGLVPESGELAMLSNLLSGVVEMYAENYEKALDHFGRCSGLPPGFGLDRLIIQCRIGVAFDNKDYREFLTLSLQFQESSPDDPMTAASVSSAYACLYAVNGNNKDKEKAMEFLSKAEKLSENTPDSGFDDYKERILYRIETRQVLTRQEYYKRMGKPLPEDEE